MSEGPPAANPEEPGWREVWASQVREGTMIKGRTSPSVRFTMKGSRDVYMLGKKRKGYPMKQESQRWWK